MSDFEDSDTEFDNLRLISPRNLAVNQENGDAWSEPLGDEREFEATFNGSFLEANLFGKSKSGGFGDQTFSEDDDDDVEKTKEKEEFVGLDWDASRIFENLACPESNHETSVCVLRLHDVLTKSEMGVQKMTRQLINCGRRINRYSPENRHDMGFKDTDNVANLARMIRSFRANAKLLLIEIEDLQELIQPASHQKSGNKSNFSKTFLISGVIFAIPLAAFMYRRCF